MDGVTILTEYQQTCMSGSMCVGLCILAGIIFVFSIITIMLNYDNTFFGILSTGGVIFGVIMFFVCITLFLSPSHTEYKITVDNTVSLAELTEHYQIVSQYGKLFTVKDLEELE